MLDIMQSGGGDTSGWQQSPVDVLASPSIFGEGSGIYLIEHIATGTQHTVYVDDVRDEGGWVLIANYTNSQVQRKFNELTQIGGTINPYNQINDVNKPCLSKLTINDFNQWMFTSSNSGWKALYGDYQVANMAPPYVDKLVNKSGFVTRTPLGDKVLYGNKAGWYVDNAMSDEFGLWTTYGNQGPCGGANVVGPNKICTIISSAGTSLHCDLSSGKGLWVRDVEQKNIRKIRKVQ